MRSLRFLPSTLVFTFATFGACLSASCGDDDSAPDGGTQLPFDSGTSGSSGSSGTSGTSGSSGTSGDAGSEASDDATVDAHADADAAPGNPVVLFGTASTGGYGLVYRDGVWSAPAKIADDAYNNGGGGIASLPGGHALAAFRPGASNKFLASMFAASWPAATQVGSSLVVNDMGTGPAVAGTKAHVAYETTDGIRLATYDTTTSTWTATEEKVLDGNPDLKPSVAVTDAGNPVVVYATGVGNPRFDWTTRSGTTWSTPVTFTKLTPDGATAAPHPLLVKRIGHDEIYGFFYAKDPVTSGDALDVTVYSGGAWSDPKAIVTDIALVDANDRLASAVALADGRIALAYKTATKSVSVSVFDGTKWTVTPTSATSVGAGTTLTPGVGAATLELVYVDASQHLQHARLLGSSWSAPSTVDSTLVWSAVFAATP